MWSQEKGIIPRSFIDAMKNPRCDDVNSPEKTFGGNGIYSQKVFENKFANTVIVREKNPLTAKKVWG